MTFLLPFLCLYLPNILAAQNSSGISPKSLSLQGALCLSERQRRGVLRQRDIPDLDILVCPLVEELDAANLGGDILGEDLVAGRLDLNLDIAGFRHNCYLCCGGDIGGVRCWAREKWSIR